jgi:hypothetical protein
MEILDARSPAPPADDAAVAALFRARYQEMVQGGPDSSVPSAGPGGCPLPGLLVEESVYGFAA